MYPFLYNDSQNKPEEVLFSGFNLNSSQSPQGGFGLTPNRLTFDKNITDFAARLFPVLVSLSNNEKGYCFVTNKVLCDWFGFGITKIQEAIKNLKDNGYITVTIIRDEKNQVIERQIRVVNPTGKTQPTETPSHPGDPSPGIPGDPSPAIPGIYINNKYYNNNPLISPLGGKAQTSLAERVLQIEKIFEEKIWNVGIHKKDRKDLALKYCISIVEQLANYWEKYQQNLKNTQQSYSVLPKSFFSPKEKLWKEWIHREPELQKSDTSNTKHMHQPSHWRERLQIAIRQGLVNNQEAEISEWKYLQRSTKQVLCTIDIEAIHQKEKEKELQKLYELNCVANINPYTWRNIALQHFSEEELGFRDLDDYNVPNTPYYKVWQWLVRYGESLKKPDIHHLPIKDKIQLYQHWGKNFKRNE